MVGFCGFGVPRFSVQRSQNPFKQAFWDLWAKIGAPQKREIQPRLIQPTILGPLITPQPEIIAKLLSKTLFCVTEIRFIIKPKPFSHVIL